MDIAYPSRMRSFDIGRDPVEVAAALGSLGPVEGRDLMVHASLRKLGPVRGGAAGVLRAIRIALGSAGTMVMMIAADDARPFDRLSTAADPEIGVLAEVFRRHPGVEVSDHPACRFAAWGPSASVLLDPQPLHHYYGPGSPLERLCDRGGAVLRLGADPDTVTLTHYAEYRADLPAKRTVRRRYRRADTGDVDIDSLDDTDGIADWAHGDYFAQIFHDSVAEGLAATGLVGDCTAELLDARTFVGFATSWMEAQLG